MNKKYVEFDVLKEDFTICQVENGQILRLKQSLIDIAQVTDENGKTEIKLGLKEVSGVSTTVEIDTSDLELTDVSQVTEKDHVKELEFKIIKNPTNVYETEKSIILIITKVTKIFLTNKKDHANAPFLRYTAEHNMSIIKKAPDLEAQKNTNESKAEKTET